MNKHELLDLIENIKEKITDNEYKLLVEKLATIDTGAYQILVTIKREDLVCEYDSDEDEFISKITPRIVESCVYQIDLNCNCNKCVRCLLKSQKKLRNVSGHDQLQFSDKLKMKIEDEYQNDLKYTTVYAKLDDIITSQSVLFQPSVKIDVEIL